MICILYQTWHLFLSQSWRIRFHLRWLFVTLKYSLRCIFGCLNIAYVIVWEHSLQKGFSKIIDTGYYKILFQLKISLNQENFWSKPLVNQSKNKCEKRLSAWSRKNKNINNEVLIHALEKTVRFIKLRLGQIWKVDKSVLNWNHLHQGKLWVGFFLKLSLSK